MLQGGVDGELDPEDDPNNQGEDEFEEAEDEQMQHRVAHEEEEVEEEEEEPAAPAQHTDTHANPNQPAVEEELVVSKGPESGNSITGLRLKREEVETQCSGCAWGQKETLGSRKVTDHSSVLTCVFRWLETQINRKTRWMTSTRRR